MNALDVPALTSRLKQAEREVELMKQFFHEHALREKHTLRENDDTRLQRLRESDAYRAAYVADPLVTVIIATYNRANLVIARAIPSLLAQTHANWELIIVGDCMDAGQAALLEEATKIDPRIHFHNLKVRGKYPQTPGPKWYVAGTKPVNFGLRVARGQWIAHLDDDDEFLPDHLSALLDQVRETKAEWAHSKVRFMDDDGNEQGIVGAEEPAHSTIASIGNLYHSGLKTFRCSNTCWKYFCPGDWDRWDRFLQMGVRHVHCDRVTAVHHGDYYREGLLDDDTQIRLSVSDEPPYGVWLDRQVVPAVHIDTLRSQGVAPERIETIVVPAASSEASAERTLASVAAQSLGPVPCHRLDASATQPDEWVAAVNARAAKSSAEWLVLVGAGDELGADTAVILAEKARSYPELVFCYFDEDTLGEHGSNDPVFKPDINLDLLRSYPYIGRAFAVKREALLAMGGLAGGQGDLAGYDLAFRTIEQFGLPAVGHVDAVLHHSAVAFSAWLSSPEVTGFSRAVVSAHLDRLGVAHEIETGPVPGTHRVRYQHDGQPAVSIIIPTRDQLPLLNALVDSLLAKTGYTNYELLIVDNDSQDPAACAFLDGIEKLGSPQLRVLRYPHPFNYAAINNFAASQARGEYLVLLNNDTAVLHEDWIEGLLHHAMRPEVGIVGAKLHYPDGRIQHAGVVLGLRGPADHPYIGETMEATGYMHRLQVDQNYSAVTAACLMIRKCVYDEVGGLDEERFKVSYNDVDLCLKVQQAGYLNVWTPYVRLMHEGSVSQTKVDTTADEAKRKRFAGEQEAMYDKWLPLLARDPAYNRNLSLNSAGFQIDFTRGDAWQPFSTPVLPRIFGVAADSQGCGHYRIRQPFDSMRRAGLVEGSLNGMHLLPVDMERFGPDAIVLQRQLSDAQIESMRRYHSFIKAFKVYELDDYLPNVPLKSAHYGSMPNDVMRALRQALRFVDRFVVSTEPLAEAFSGLHSDVVVVPNRLPTHWWAGLDPQRRSGAKPRVGWAGGSSHRGDLDLIADVVRDLADEVEWVFFGMCPEKVREYVHEVHVGVPIEEYPQALAALNLDLALAPLEDNQFNRCKSNLRLLEYGACGYPVICSDVLCYRGDLPVTRVKNRYRDWVSAIRMHLNDLDETARRGDALRQSVRGDWMLEGEHLVWWRDVWTGR